MATRMSRRRFLSTGAQAAVVLAAGPTLLSACRALGVGDEGPIEIGGISDLTGPLAPLGQSQRQMVELAVADINARGGVLGRELEIRYVDGASDPATWATRVRDLAGVPLVIGGLTSAERDAIREAATEESLYIWPQLNEGEDQCHERMFTTGPVPDQQVLPFIDYLMEEEGARSFYFLGSDYNFPRVSNAVAMQQVEANGGEVLGEDYYSLDATDFASAVRAISSAAPDAVFSNVIPPGAFSLIRQLNEAGIWQDMVFATPGSDEGWLFGVEPDQIEGQYSCLDFYQELDDPMTQEIIAAYEEEFGGEPPISAAGGATGGYRGMQLWAEAVEAAGSLDLDAVEEAMDSASTDRAPGGRAEMVPGTRHCRVPTHIGRFAREGLTVVRSITPVPDPTQCI